jgi:hypothetical protein
MRHAWITLIPALSSVASAQLTAIELPYPPSKFYPVKVSGPFIFGFEQATSDPVVINGNQISRLARQSLTANLSDGSAGYAVGNVRGTGSSMPAAWNLKSGKRFQLSGFGNLYAASGNFAVGTLNGSAIVINLSTQQTSPLPSPTGFVTPLAVSGRTVTGVYINTSTNQRQAYYWPDFSVAGTTLNPAGSSDSSCLSTDGIQQGGQFTLSGILGDVRHPAYWTGTAASCVDLMLPNATDGYVASVLGGYQLGRSTDQEGVEHAVLWHGTVASAIDLNSLPPAGRAPAPLWPLGLARVGTHIYAYAVCDLTDRVYRWTVQ